MERSGSISSWTHFIDSSRMVLPLLVDAELQASPLMRQRYNSLSFTMLHYMLGAYSSDGIPRQVISKSIRNTCATKLLKVFLHIIIYTNVKYMVLHYYNSHHNSTFTMTTSQVLRPYLGSP